VSSSRHMPKECLKRRALGIVARGTRVHVLSLRFASLRLTPDLGSKLLSRTAKTRENTETQKNTSIPFDNSRSGHDGFVSSISDLPEWPVCGGFAQLVCEMRKFNWQH